MNMKRGEGQIIRSLMNGETRSHSRNTIVADPRFECRSKSTADRWLRELAEYVPGMRLVMIGTTPWLEYKCRCTQQTKRANKGESP